MKLAFRHDEDADLVRCYLSSLDDTDRFEVSTFKLSVLRAVPGLFDQWKKVLQSFIQYAVKEIGGGAITAWHEIRAQEKN